MELFPAIDLRGGRCVRLVEGDFAQETVYGDDPVAVARSFAASGARWVHVVDLDAARTGRAANRRVVAEIAAAVAPHAKVQCGGGVRSSLDVRELLEAGVERVVIGTAAVENPALVTEVSSVWPGRVAVGVDHRGGEVRLRGWTDGAGVALEEVVSKAFESGVAAVVVTDISRDGRLEGPDVEGLAGLLAATEGAVGAVVASGGVSGIDDLKRLAALRSPAGRQLDGVIVGKAIYEGRVDVGAALEVLRGSAA